MKCYYIADICSKRVNNVSCIYTDDFVSLWVFGSEYDCEGFSSSSKIDALD